VVYSGLVTGDTGSILTGQLYTPATRSSVAGTASLDQGDRPYHYMGSGKFFVRLGDALATAMVDSKKKQKP
jgi:hypothetical protein